MIPEQENQPRDKCDAERSYDFLLRLNFKIVSAENKILKLNQFIPRNRIEYKLNNYTPIFLLLNVL